MIEYNMQFFAEEVASEADTTVGDDVQMDPVEQEPANEEIKQVDMNRIFADARRRAEAQQKQKQNAIDKKYAERFGNNGIINPETGKPIMSASEYLDAVAAQERVAAQEELRDKGVDPAIIDRMVEASPVMKQAQAVLSENMAMRTQAKVNDDIQSIIAFDPEIGSAADIMAQDNFEDVYRYAEATKISFADAYKIVNFDRIAAARAHAAEQGAINQAYSKGHLRASAGLATNDDSVEIPASQIEMWKEAFPDKSPAQLKKLYNAAMKTRG